MSLELKPTCDRKTRFRNAQKNTYGLLPGREGTCPLATIGKGGCSQVVPGRKLPTCYVFNVMAAYKAVGPVLQHNTDLIRNSTQQDRVNILKQEFERFRKLELKQADPKLYYRLHWSGDVFDEDYADALIEAMCAFPDVTFWNYTRNFPLAPKLADNTPNLIQYISLDVINFEAGLDVYFKWLKSNPPHNNLAICYMAPTDDSAERFAEARTRHPDWPEKLEPHLRACPADTKDIPVDGACAKCKRCLLGRPVWFCTK